MIIALILFLVAVVVLLVLLNLDFYVWHPLTPEGREELDNDMQIW